MLPIITDFLALLKHRGKKVNLRDQHWTRGDVSGTALAAVMVGDRVLAADGGRKPAASAVPLTSPRVQC